MVRETYGHKLNLPDKNYTLEQIEELPPEISSIAHTQHDVRMVADALSKINYFKA